MSLQSGIPGSASEGKGHFAADFLGPREHTGSGEPSRLPLSHDLLEDGVLLAELSRSPRHLALPVWSAFASSVPREPSPASLPWLFCRPPFVRTQCKPAPPRTAARQASLSITNSRSLLKLMSTELVMPSSHPILCCPLLLPPSIVPSIGVISKEWKWPPSHQVAKVLALQHQFNYISQWVSVIVCEYTLTLDNEYLWNQAMFSI